MLFIEDYSFVLKESFRNSEMWFNLIQQNANQNVKRLLVGNKCDLTSKRVVDYAKGQVCKVGHVVELIACLVLFVRNLLIR